MPSFVRRFSIPINTTVENVLAGSQYEFAPFNGVVEIGIFAARDLITCSVFSGPDVLGEPGGAVPFGTARAPIYPDDYQYEDEVAAGDRIKVQLVNSNASAGPDLVFVAVRITPK